MDSLFNFAYSRVGGVENVLIWLNLLGATGAFLVNRKAYKIGIPSHRKTSFLVARISVFYIVAFGVLILFDPSYLEWASIMRGVALVVWPVVWMQPAWMSIKIWREFPNLLREGLEGIPEGSSLNDDR